MAMRVLSGFIFGGMRTSLIIATYNWPDALRLCLMSVRQQVVLPDEVLIADDGSREETRMLIEDYASDFPVPLRHIWHPDEGFRLAEIRNKGISAAHGDYLIQIDGDLILHPHFIADHLELARPGYFTAGSRVMLSEGQSRQLIEQRSIQLKGSGFNALRSKWLRHYLRNRYKIKGRHLYYVKGANMAFFKSDLLRVNGYNEAFRGWGSEDRELAIRLINAGVKKQSAKMGAIAYHLWHKVASRASELANEQLMHDAAAKGVTWAERGIL
jgi:glycosyltransferase involved in cell wall biosynthesis